MLAKGPGQASNKMRWIIQDTEFFFSYFSNINIPKVFCCYPFSCNWAELYFLIDAYTSNQDGFARV